jgi:lysophospholipase L1-like esterase
MLECLIMGDSIAVGIAQQRPDCVVEAKVGINSMDYVNGLYFFYAVTPAKTTVISLGSNDWDTSETYPVLVTLRDEIKGSVLWILPARNDEARNVMLTIARERGDAVADTRAWPLSLDGVHPSAKGYRGLAKSF